MTRLPVPVLLPRPLNIKLNSPKLSPNSNLTSERRSRRSIRNVSLVVPRRRSKRFCRNDSRGNKPTWRRKEDPLQELEVSWEGRAGQRKGRGRRRSVSSLSPRVRSRRRSSIRPFSHTLDPCITPLVACRNFSCLEVAALEEAHCEVSYTREFSFFLSSGPCSDTRAFPLAQMLNVFELDLPERRRGFS